MSYGLTAAWRGIVCLAKSFQEDFFVASLRPIEKLFAVYLIVSSTVVLNPRINVYGNGGTYAYITWLPEPIFGGLLLATGLIILASHCMDNRLYQLGANIVQLFLFGFMFVLFFSANTKGLIIPWIGVNAIMSLIRVMRLTERVWRER